MGKKIKTTQKNAKNVLISMYRSECRGFSSQLKYIYSLSLSVPEKYIDIPASPARGDNSAEAVALRAEISARKKQNKHIDEINSAIDLAKKIIAILDIKSISKSAIKDIYQRVIDAYPYKTADNICVMSAPLPEYLGKEYAIYRRVVVADWVTVIAGAAKALSEHTAADNTYMLTASPAIGIDNSVVSDAVGSIVADNMDIVSDSLATDILANWTKKAVCQKVASKAGTQKKKDVYIDMLQNM